MKNLPSVDTVLEFSSDIVVFRFQEIYGLKYEESLEIFEDVKRWLWLSAYRDYEDKTMNSNPPILSMFSALAVIDEMWHNFIICTSEYTCFCDTYFGYYLHHQVVPRAGNEKIYAGSPEAFQIPSFDHIQLQAMMMYVYEKLGEHTYQRWFEIYPKTYSIENLRNLSRHLK